MRYSISEWGCVIDGGQNMREKLFDLIIKNIEGRNPPQTDWRFEKITTKDLLVIIPWKKREFLVVKSKMVKGYEIDVCADPFGNTLAVHSALVTFKKPEDWEKKKISWEDQTLLSDWTTLIFHSVQDACRELMKDIGQSPEKLKAEAKGILSVW